MLALMLISLNQLALLLPGPFSLPLILPLLRVLRLELGGAFQLDWLGKQDQLAPMLVGTYTFFGAFAFRGYRSMG